MWLSVSVMCAAVNLQNPLEQAQLSSVSAGSRRSAIDTFCASPFAAAESMPAISSVDT